MRGPRSGPEGTEEVTQERRGPTSDRRSGREGQAQVTESEVLKGTVRVDKRRT